MLMKTAVCDDDQLIREQMRGILEKQGEYPCSVRLFRSGEELLRDEETFDLIFLDIDMKGIDGLQTAAQIRKRDKRVKIIYLTSYKDYTPHAFRVHAFAYLLKPVKEEQIYAQLREAALYSTSEKPPTVLDFWTTDGTVRLSPEDIRYFEYIDRKIRIVAGEREYRMVGRIADTADRMRQWDFCMPHKSFVVNLYYVKSIKGAEVTLMDGTVLPLSQKKAAAFREQMNEYLIRRLG